MMEPLGRLLLFSCVVGALCKVQLEYTECTKPTGNDDNFFQYKIEGLKKGEVINFDDYRGSVVLAVNVATF
jgi:hypothetical protein